MDQEKGNKIFKKIWIFNAIFIFKVEKYKSKNKILMKNKKSFCNDEKIEKLRVKSKVVKPVFLYVAAAAAANLSYISIFCLST